MKKFLEKFPKQWKYRLPFFYFFGLVLCIFLLLAGFLVPPLLNCYGEGERGLCFPIGMFLFFTLNYPVLWIFDLFHTMWDLYIILLSPVLYFIAGAVVDMILKHIYQAGKH